MGKFKDLTGLQFGRLKVIKRVDDYIQPSGKPKTMWLCECTEDGNLTTVEAYSLTSGKTTSCGCYGKEQRLKTNTKHGLSHSRLKRAYYNMKSRCYNSNTPKYNNHGGRGIRVCDEWLGENGFMNFHSWAINNGYSDELTLDRIDNDGNYEPSNCRWADYETQNLNKRDNRLFTINGETKTAKEWCIATGVNINTFWKRDFLGLSETDLIKINKN